MKTYLSIVITLLLSAPAGYAQKLNLNSPEFRFAEYLQGQGRNFDAITEYKRFIHFCKNDSLAAFGRYRIAQNYIAGKRWESAAANLKTALGQYSITPARLALAETYERSGNYALARLECSDILSERKLAKFHPEAYYRQGRTFLQEYKWRDAESSFRRAGEFADSAGLLARLKRYPAIPHRSPKAAYWLSTFIPGSGQMYAGKILHGLLAMGVNIGIGYLMYDRWNEKDYLNFTTAYLFLWMRYYPANRANARRFAEEFNRRKQEEFLSSLHLR